MAYPELYEQHFAKGRPERGQSGSALTGEVAAALAANGVVWTLRYPQPAVRPAAGALSFRLYVQRIHVQYVTGVVFTAPVTVGRALRLVRGAPTSASAGASDPSGGAAYTMVKKRSDLTGETLAIGRVATTGALTTTGFTFETNPIQRMMLVGSGAAGAQYDEVWRFDGVESDPVVLLPGELLAISADSLFDAGGTFQLNVDVDCVEVAG